MLSLTPISSDSSFFFFNDTATTEIYTLSLHDALPISSPGVSTPTLPRAWTQALLAATSWGQRDRKSTRLNSSHGYISYAVFCLKKKKKKQKTRHYNEYNTYNSCMKA